MSQLLMGPIDAIILGCVEGLTEFLPVSSTGHLILASRFLGLPQNSGLHAFEIAIQVGALTALLGVYFRRLWEMALGLLGKNREGLVLLIQLGIAVMPAVVLGVLWGEWIDQHLFGLKPVLVALAVGGCLMIVAERWRYLHLRKMQQVEDFGILGRDAAKSWIMARGRSMASMTWGAALIIGLAQCVAMWPGTSRSMMTMTTALLLGFSPIAAAEFSFLLALPTLSGAAIYSFYQKGPAMLDAAGWSGLVLGFGFSYIAAWIAVKGFLAYLTKHGMEIFGWYRLVLAGIIAFLLL